MNNCSKRFLAIVFFIAVTLSIVALSGHASDKQPDSLPQAANSIRVPLCPGLTIVTAISQLDGDYESIKTIESVNDREVRLKYSSERMFKDLMDNEPKLQRTVMNRTVLKQDLATANLYEQQFYDKLPDPIPGTTAIGTSAAVLNAVKTKGEVEIGFFVAFINEPSLDREVHPNVFDNQMTGTFHRVEPGPVMLPVIVNNARVQLPAIHIAGDFVGDKTEFFFLDDPANPIALKWRYGIDSVNADDVQAAKKAGMKLGPDLDSLEVIKITYRCGEPSTDKPSAAEPGQLEKSLAATGRADVYDIYFSFNSDQIREESEPRIKEIADALNKHSDWKLSVEGHTDGVGAAGYNLDLSRRRAAAVKDALVKRYKIDPGRLTTAGFGASRPKDTNDTLAGRARNRRVELVRQ
jgi:outer membrane protein OmpA-like peptidoglycan-associated protein